MLHNWQDHKKYADASKQLEVLRGRIAALQQEEAIHAQSLQEAQQRLEAAEANLILDRVSEADVRPLREAVNALAVSDNPTLRRLETAAGILEKEMPGLKEEAVKQFCNERQPGYKKALRELSAKLMEADKAYQEVKKLYIDANNVSPDRYTQLAHGNKNPDLPEALGLPQFGLDLFELPDATIWDKEKPSRLLDRVNGQISDYIG